MQIAIYYKAYESSACTPPHEGRLNELAKLRYLEKASRSLKQLRVNATSQPRQTLGRICVRKVLVAGEVRLEFGNSSCIKNTECDQAEDNLSVFVHSLRKFGWYQLLLNVGFKY